MNAPRAYSAKFDYGLDEFEIVVEIDHNIMTDEMLHMINNFWSDSQGRLSDADGDITKAVVSYLCSVVYWLACKSELGNVVSMFKEGRYTEGWPEMDGSAGIKLVSYSDITWPDIRDIEFIQVTV